MTKRQEIGSGEGFGSECIIRDFGGTLVHYEAMTSQGAGNCTLVSMETALLVFMAIRRILNFYGEEQTNIVQCDMGVEAWKQIFNFVRQEYNAWWNFDRELIFEDMIEEIQEWIDGKNTSFSQHSLYNTYQQLLHNWYEKYGHEEPLEGKPFSGLVNLVLNKFF